MRAKWLKKIWMCFLFIAVVVGTPYDSYSQNYRFLNGRQPYVHIPFEFLNNFIVINLRVNGLPLRFVLDTGAEHSILFHTEIAQALGLEMGRRVRVMGADLSSEIYAYVTTGVTFILEDQCQINTSMLILEENFLEMEQLIGLPIAGVLGSSNLRHFVVQIDYIKSILSLYDPGYFQLPHGFQSINIEIEKSKPYIHTYVKVKNRDKKQAKLLIDTGASLAALFYATESNQIALPDTLISGVLGIGLGGRLRGFMGAIDKLDFGPFSFQHFLCSFQKLENQDSLLYQHNKDGLIGNAILSRFTVLIDYKQKKLHLKTNRYFKKKITYDRSGLMLISTGPNLNRIKVLDLIAGSPADLAGIKPGDEITHYRGIPINFIGFDKLLRKLSGPVGKKIKLSIKSENNRKKRIQFFLRDLL